MEIHSRNLSKNLKGCRQVVLLCGTLGIQVDYLIKRYSYTEMAKAVVMQACAAALLEEYLDERQEEIKYAQRWKNRTCICARDSARDTVIFPFFTSERF